MSRRTGLVVTSVAIFFFVIYVANDFTVTMRLKSWSEMLSLALDTPQKYLWNIALCHLPILFFLREPYLQATYQVRMRPHVIWCVLKKAALRSILMTALIYTSYFTYAVGAKLSLLLSIELIGAFVRLLSFSLFCNLLYFVLYWTLKKEVLGMTGMLLINIVILLIISETEFQFPKETLTGLNSYFMTLFTSVGNGICITTLCWLVKKQENFD